MKEIIVGNNELDKRLDSFLKSYLKNASGGFIYKMLRKKNITLNDKKAEGTEKLKKGDSIKIFFSDDTLEKFIGTSVGIDSKNNSVKDNKSDTTSNTKVSKAYDSVIKKLGSLQVIYEDENILLVNKPAGVLSQKAERNDVSLNDWLIAYLLEKGDITEESLLTYKPSICNRLDRNTSGLVICAKSLLGARVMNTMLKDRTLDKYYRTICSGRIDKPFELKGFLYKDEGKNKVHIVTEDPHDDNYSYIETYFEPISYDEREDLTYLEVKLVTGKPHQIRAHLSSIGNPIIGDVKYGGKKIGKQNFQLLHSYRVRFPKEMPEGLENIAGKEFIAQLPVVFRNFFDI